MVDIQASLALSLDGLKQSTENVGQAVREQSAWMMERYRGESFTEIPTIQATATGGQPFTMGGDSGLLLQSPEQGFVWSIRALVIEGLARGATPDVIQIRKSTATGRIIWELNGNQYCQTWGRGERILKAGETLFYTSIGNISTTTLIKAYGNAQQLPGERSGVFG